MGGRKKFLQQTS